MALGPHGNGRLVAVGRNSGYCRDGPPAIVSTSDGVNWVVAQFQFPTGTIGLTGVAYPRERRQAAGHRHDDGPSLALCRAAVMA